MLTKDRASQLMSGRSLDELASDWTAKLRVENAYSIPPDSGKKTALSKSLAELLLKDARVYLYVSGWGVWATAEHMDLFHGYRKSIGETRTLMEAPVHLFEGHEKEAFVSILSMVLYFAWDAWILDVEEKPLVRVSHDEWLEVLAKDEGIRKLVALELGTLGMPRLSR